MASIFALRLIDYSESIVRGRSPPRRTPYFAAYDAAQYLLFPIVANGSSLAHYRFEILVLLNQYFAKDSLLPQEDRLQTHQLQNGEKGTHQRVPGLHRLQQAFQP